MDGLKNVDLCDLSIGEINLVTPHPSEKYHFVYENKKFKNVQIHGIVVDVVTTNPIYRFILSDYTGVVDVFFHPSKSQHTITSAKYSALCDQLDAHLQNNNPDKEKATALLFMKDRIGRSLADQAFKVKDYVNVVGEIFIDKMTNRRCVSSVNCAKSSFMEDYLWINKLCDAHERSESEHCDNKL